MTKGVTLALPHLLERPAADLLGRIKTAIQLQILQIWGGHDANGNGPIAPTRVEINLLR